jgi:hypothetical protein
MRIVKWGNKNTKSLAGTSLVWPILEYRAACWDPYRECQISALDQVQNKAAKFAYHIGGPVWEPLVQRRRTARMCELYKAYNGERAWKDIGDRLQVPYYRSTVDHCWKIRSKNIRTDVGKFSFVNRPSLAGIGYLKGRLGLPSLKCMYSERGLGKYISEVK